MHPILLNIGSYSLEGYPLLMGLAWGIAFHFALNFKYQTAWPWWKFLTFCVGSFVSVWLGSKLFYLWFSSGDLSSLFINFWLGGGFVFYGGLVFLVTYFLLSIFLFKTVSLNFFIYFMPFFPLVHGIGRIGCFLAGCCYGGKCDLPWAIHLHGELRHPVQLYESFTLFILSFLLFKLKRDNLWWMTGLYFSSYAFIRFILEFWRGDLVRGVWALNLSTSQYISILMFGVGIFCLWKAKPRQTLHSHQ
jgi:phosphatidylglycerol---prolipoprotein diacylglyceryl transferase